MWSSGTPLVVKLLSGHQCPDSRPFGFLGGYLPAFVESPSDRILYMGQCVLPLGKGCGFIIHKRTIAIQAAMFYTNSIPQLLTHCKLWERKS